jgi:hypothetical protein
MSERTDLIEAELDTLYLISQLLNSTHDLQTKLQQASRYFLVKIFLGFLPKNPKKLRDRYIATQARAVLDQYRPRPNKGIVNIAPIDSTRPTSRDCIFSSLNSTLSDSFTRYLRTPSI